MGAPKGETEEKEEHPWQQKLGNIITDKDRKREEARVHPEGKPVACSIGDVPKEPRQWCAFEFADVMEQGLAPGLTSGFVEPAEAGTEERLRVQRADNNREYLLTSPKKEPLLLAVASTDFLRFEIFIAKPGKPALALGPAFVVESSNSKREMWTLTSLRCERCEERGTRACGVRKLATMRHYMEPVGSGQALCMDVDLPAPLSPEQGGSIGSAVWCSVCSGQQEKEEEVSLLTSKRPSWSAKHRTLTLNFNGRCSVASSKNFQLEECPEEGATPGDSERTLLFGKTGADLFVLDYKRPFGMVEAFAAALTVSHWK